MLVYQRVTKEMDGKSQVMIVNKSHFLGGGLYDICIIMIIMLDEYTTQWL
jgi:hypothetical protein